MTSATGRPTMASAKGSVALQPIRLGAGTPYDEDWLQRLIFEHPEALPVTDIEPGFGELIPIAMEVPCGHGFIDNLYLTPSADIVVVETKLWGNVEARRKVVAQALDYAAALSSMPYDVFETAVLRGETRLAKPASLHALVADHPDALPEDRFIDAVASNLRRGRMLVMAAGDGIRREAQLLADLLQSHAGAHFTFALVELAPYRIGDTDDVLVVPATLLKTAMVTRGVVVVEDTRTFVKPVPTRAAQPAQAQTLTEQDFYALMAERSPDLPRAIQDLIAGLETIGGYAEMRSSLNLKIEIEGLDRPVNLASIQRNGQVWTSYGAAALPRDVAERYARTLADCIGGIVGFEAAGAPYVTTNGKSAPRIEQLVPAHTERWLRAIEAIVATTRMHEAEPA